MGYKQHLRQNKEVSVSVLLVIPSIPNWNIENSAFQVYLVIANTCCCKFGGIIFGKTTYKMFEEFWPKAIKDPKTPGDDRKIAQIIDDVWKIVFSKSLKEVTWKNSKLYHDIDPKEVSQWKKYQGGDLVIFGSGTIVQQFTNLGLVDEYRLLVNPIVLGKGKPMFANMKDKVNLKLVKTREFKNGNVLLYYAPAQLKK